MLPFDLLEYEDVDGINKVLGVEPDWNAWVELHNVIVSAETIHDFGPHDARRIGREHGLDFGDAFFDERVGLYSSFLDHCLDRGDLTDSDRATLAHLATSLLLTTADARPYHERAFGRAVSNVLSDDCVTIEERLLLYKLQHVLDIHPDDADVEYEEAARRKLLTIIAKAMCDGHLSPQELAHIRQKRDEFGIEIPPKMLQLLTDAVGAWNIMHGELTETPVRIKLQTGEVGHFSAKGVWGNMNYAQLRVELSSYRRELSDGETFKLRIPSESIEGRRKKCQIVVTNKRLILAQSSRKRDLYLKQLAGVEQYQNGLRLVVKDRRSIYLDAGRRNLPLFALLERLIASRN